jgi:hypothetical protein
VSPERWNVLTREQRKQAVIKHDKSGTMRGPQWTGLLEQMARPYEELTRAQQDVVKELL